MTEQRAYEGARTLPLSVALCYLLSCGAKAELRAPLPEEQPLNTPIPRLTLTSEDVASEEDPATADDELEPRPTFPDSLSTPWYDLRGTRTTPIDERLDAGAENYCETDVPGGSVGSGHFEEREPDNDTVCGARSQLALGTGSEVSARLQPEDTDWFMLYVETDSTYQLGLRCTTDTLLSVFSATGDLLGRDDNGGVGACSRLTLALPAGTHSARVEPAHAAAQGEYTLRLTQR